MTTNHTPQMGLSAEIGLSRALDQRDELIAALAMICNYMAHDDDTYVINSDDMETARTAKTWQRISLERKRAIVRELAAEIESNGRLSSVPIAWGGQ